MITPCPDPTVDELRTRLEDFFGNEADESDTLLFYYSGHGVVQTGDAYICAANTQTSQQFLTARTAISAGEIVYRVKQSKAAAKVIILDCCQAAPINSNPYEGFDESVAVLLASRGIADDAKEVQEPSPFTRSLVAVLRDPREYGDTGLTVGGLVTALKKRGESPWTNPKCAGHILLVASTAGAEPVPDDSWLGVTVEIAADCVPDDRLPLLRQLAVTLDGLLTVAPEEVHQIPSSVASDGMWLLAAELRRLALNPELERELDEARREGERLATCALRFTDDARSRLGDLPWEYLALPTGARSGNDGIAVARHFDAPRPKRGPQEIQRVALFSSRRSTDSLPDPLTSATTKELEELGMLKPEDCATSATWTVFQAAPDNADVVILQTPVSLVDIETEADGGAKKVAKEVAVLFATPGDQAKEVMADQVAATLKRRGLLGWLLVETVADNSQKEPALAVRRLAQELAAQLERPVVAVCHSRAYLSCLEKEPGAATFLAHLLKGLGAGSSLDRAVRDARAEAMLSLGISNPAIVGIPIVMQPVEREAAREGQRPSAQR